jgi:hypothetical protein
MWWGEAPERPRHLARGYHVAQPIDYIGPKRLPSRAEDGTTPQRDDQPILLHGRAYPNGAGVPSCRKMARAGTRLGDLSAQYVGRFAERDRLASVSRKFRSLAPPMLGFRSQFGQLKRQKAGPPGSSNAGFLSDLVGNQFGRFSNIRLEITAGYHVFSGKRTRVVAAFAADASTGSPSVREADRNR